MRAERQAPCVIVRPGHLLDSAGTGKYQLLLRPSGYSILNKIPRADVAAFLLRAVASSEWDGKAVQIHA